MDGDDSRIRLVRLFCVASGAVLMVAATTKLLAVFDDVYLFGRRDFSGDTLYALSVAVIPIEVFLGIMLIRIRPPQWIYRFTATLFAAFSIVAVVEIARGGTVECGCLGRQSMSPYMRLTMAGLGATVFWVIRNIVPRKETPRYTLWFAHSFAFVAVVFVAYGVASKTDIRAGITKKAIVLPSRWNAAGRTGDLLEVQIPAINITAVPVVIHGINGGCGVVFDNVFPLLLTPGQPVLLNAKGKIAQEPSLSRLRFSIYLATGEGVVRQEVASAIVGNGRVFPVPHHALWDS